MSMLDVKIDYDLVRWLAAYVPTTNPSVVADAAPYLGETEQALALAPYRSIDHTSAEAETYLRRLYEALLDAAMVAQMCGLENSPHDTPIDDYKRLCSAADSVARAFKLYQEAMPAPTLPMYNEPTIPHLTIADTVIPDGASFAWRSIVIAAEASKRHESRVRACVVHALHRAYYDLTRRSLDVDPTLLEWVRCMISGDIYIQEHHTPVKLLSWGVPAKVITIAAVLLQLDTDYAPSEVGGFESTCRTDACRFAARNRAASGDTWTAAIKEAARRLGGLAPTSLDHVARILADHVAILCAAAATECTDDSFYLGRGTARIGYEVTAMAALQWIERVAGSVAPIDCDPPVRPVYTAALDIEVQRLAGAIRQGPHLIGRRLDRQATRLLGNIYQWNHVDPPPPQEAP